LFVHVADVWRSIQYRVVIITLFGPVGEGDHLGQTIWPSSIEQCRLIRLQSAKEIARYFHIYRRLYGLTQLPRQMLRPISSTLEILFDDVGSDESREAIIELLQFFSAFAKRFRCVFGMFQRLEERVFEFGDKVPLEVVDIFEAIERDIGQLS
jgi:hypothetical protein